MRYVTVMFDAPLPARKAVQALYDAGFDPGDLLLVPELPGVEWSRAECFARPWLDRGLRVDRMLKEMGVPPDEALAYTEGLHRGAILIAVRAPTLAADGAARALLSAAPPDLATHQARWADDPDTVYGWSVVDSPELSDTGFEPEPVPDSIGDSRSETDADGDTRSSFDPDGDAWSETDADGDTRSSFDPDGDAWSETDADGDTRSDPGNDAW